MTIASNFATSAQLVVVNYLQLQLSHKLAMYMRYIITIVMQQQRWFGSRIMCSSGTVTLHLTVTLYSDVRRGE